MSKRKSINRKQTLKKSSEQSEPIEPLVSIVIL